MHIVSTIANHSYLQLERVLGESVMDVYAYLQYINAKVSAENAQRKFENEMNKRKKR